MTQATETITPTATERAMLRLLRDHGPRSVWEFGSSNVSRTRRAGYIATRDGKAHLTPAGLAEAGKVST